MIRLIIRTQSAGMAANVAGAKAEIDFKTFDVEIPEVESYLREAEKWDYTNRQIIGVELL